LSRDRDRLEAEFEAFSAPPCHDGSLIVVAGDTFEDKRIDSLFNSLRRQIDGHRRNLAELTRDHAAGADQQRSARIKRLEMADIVHSGGGNHDPDRVVKPRDRAGEEHEAGVFRLKGRIEPLYRSGLRVPASGTVGCAREMEDLGGMQAATRQPVNEANPIFEVAGIKPTRIIIDPAIAAAEAHSDDASPACSQPRHERRSGRGSIVENQRHIGFGAAGRGKRWRHGAGPLRYRKPR
jgi:hypothetical protein